MPVNPGFVSQNGVIAVNNPTALHFGPNVSGSGPQQLYVASQKDGISVFDVSTDATGQYVVTPAAGTAALADLVNQIPNHNDDGSLGGPNKRQITGMIVTDDGNGSPVIYVTSSDSRITVSNDSNLDTNSGILSKITLVNGEWDKVDLVRGLPRSEENHSTNGIDITNDGQYLLVAQGGHTNAGAPGDKFSFTPEYQLTGTTLKIDLGLLDAMPVNGTGPNKYVFDMPTLDDPTVENVTDGVGEDEFGFDENGPFGGNDGRNQAILGKVADPRDPTGNTVSLPVSIFDSGYRNQYDVEQMANGDVFVFDNGPNGGWGGQPVDVDGNLTVLNGAPSSNRPSEQPTAGSQDHLHLATPGHYAGSTNPTIANAGALSLWEDPETYSYENGGVDDLTEIATRLGWDANDRAQAESDVAGQGGGDAGLHKAIRQNYDDQGSIWYGALKVRDEYQNPDGSRKLLTEFVPDAADSNGKYAEVGFNLDYAVQPDEHVWVKADNGLGTKADGSFVSIGGSTNGLAEYTAPGVLQGSLIVSSFNDNVYFLKYEKVVDPNTNEVTGLKFVDLEGNEITSVNNLLGLNVPSNPLNVAMGPDGTVWVAQHGGDKITVLVPGDPAIVQTDDDDEDGVLNENDPFDGDAGNGLAFGQGESRVWNFDPDETPTNPYASELAGGLGPYASLGFSGGWTNFADPDASADAANLRALDSGNVLNGGVAGNVQIKDVSTGSAIGSANDHTYGLQFGLDLDTSVDKIAIEAKMENPWGFISSPNGDQGIGLAFGPGDQRDFFSARFKGDETIEIVMEDDDVPTVVSVNAPGVTNTGTGAQIVLRYVFNIDRAGAGSATVDVTWEYDGNTGSETGINVTGATLDALLGQHQLTDAAGNLILDESSQPIDSGFGVTLFATKGASDGTVFMDFREITVSTGDASGNFVPVARFDAPVDTDFETPVTVSSALLLSNDNDLDGDALTLAAPTLVNPAAGTVSLDVNGDIVYTPAGGFFGSAEIEYTVDDGNGGTTTGLLEIDVARPVVDGAVLYRVNAGGGAIEADPNDPNSTMAWAANTGNGAKSGDGFANNTGQTSSHDGTLQRAPELAGFEYVPDAVFETERWDLPASPVMTYSFDVDAGLTYGVRLFMRNGFGGTSEAGERVFDIEIEGNEVFSGIDLAKDYGHLTGTVFETVVQAGDNSLDIAFLHDVENPLVNAIEIVQVGNATPPPVVSVSGASIGEADHSGQVQVVFNLEGPDPVDEDIVIQWAVRGDTATPVNNQFPGGDFDMELLGPNGVDFDLTQFAFVGTSTIASGSFDSTIFIDIIDDLEVEGNETFTVEIVSVTGADAIIGTGSADVTIVDNDILFVPGDIAYRVNAGGEAVVDPNGGPDWGEDQAEQANDGSEANASANFGTNSPYLVEKTASGYDKTYGVNSFSGNNTTGAPDELFTTERFNTLAEPNNMEYAFDVSNGSYFVNLFFKELFFEEAGKRVFDVNIEQTQVIDDLDPYAAFGGNNGMKTFLVDVNDGTLNVDFLKGPQNNPTVSAIEIVAADPTATSDSFNGELARSGDFSGDRLNPTDVALGLGVNTLVAAQNPADLDYVTFTIEEGQQLSSLTLTGYTGGSDQTFIGIMTGETFPDESDLFNALGGGDPSALDGGTLVDASQIGTDVLDELTSTEVEGDVNSFEVAGLPMPLGAGTYTLWFSQNGGQTDIELDFLVEDVPTVADLSLTKIVSDSAPTYGDDVAFTLTVSNDGPDGATGVVVEDLLASGYSFVSASGDGAYDASTGEWTVGAVASGGTAELQIVATVLDPADAPDEVIYRVNVGGNEVAAADGPVWINGKASNLNGNGSTAAGEANISPQIKIVGGQNFAPGNAPTIDLSQLPADNTTPEAIFQSERYGIKPSNFTELHEWEFDVSDGGYIVNLYFAEIFATADGERTFDIFIEGVKVEDTFDIHAEVGHDVAILKSYDVEVSDGVLDIDFDTIVDNAKISGIEIIQKGGAALNYENSAQVLAAVDNDPDSTPGNGIIGEDDDATVTVTPVAASAVTVALASDISVTEGASNLLPVTVIGSLTEAIDLTVTVTGVTADGSDVSVASTVSLDQSGSILVEALADGIIEGAETLTIAIAIADAKGQDVSVTDAEATVTILDADSAQISLGDIAVDEGATGQIPVTFTSPVSQAVDLTVTVSGVTADGSDIDPIVTTLSLSDSGTIDVTALADGIVEAVETLTVSIAMADDKGQTVTVSDAAATVTINSLETTEISVGDLVLSEGTSGVVPVTFSNPTQQSVELTVTVTPGTADASDVDPIVASLTLSDSGTIDVAAIADGLAESTETLTVSVAIADAKGQAVSVVDGDATVTIDDSTVAPTGGKASLTITDGANNIQVSNFGNDSFKIVNEGTKKITKIEIDVTDAILPDAVFDPIGGAGDSAGKFLTIDTEGGTGIVNADGTNNQGKPIFNANSIGTVYVGDGGAAGFEKVVLEFSSFDPGDQLGFSVDMDPNSIAGSQKSTLDSGAFVDTAGGGSTKWDVGGIGGGELLGSTFTVTFEDGTTATGTLQSQGPGDQMGAVAVADQDSPAKEVTLTVSGVAEGGEGTYGAGGPEIIVDAEIGATVRIALLKGFIVPFTNEFADSDPYKTQLDAQLDALRASGFAANNAVEMQFVDVEITQANQVVTGFDFSGVSAYDFAGEGRVPLGFVAGVIDPSTEEPLGPVTSPIHLSYEVGGAYGPNANDDIVFEVEDAGTDNPSGWTFKTTHDDSGSGGVNENHEPFTGEGFLEWEGPQYLSNPNNGQLTYAFTPGKSGVYYVNVRSSVELGNNSTEHNDAFTRITDIDGNPLEMRPGVKGGQLVQPTFTGENGNFNDGWHKTYQSGGPSNDWKWSNKNVDNNAIPLAYELEAGETYYFQIAARSNSYAIDRVHLAYVENPPNVDPDNGPLQNTNALNPNENAPLSPQLAVPNTISVIAPGAVEETGDSGDTAAVFELDSSKNGFAGIVDLTYEVDVNGTVTQGATQADFSAGTPTITVLVPNDALDNGAESVSVRLISTTTQDVQIDATPAVTEVTEDDSNFTEGAVLLRINPYGPELAAIDGTGVNWLEDSVASPISYFSSSQNRGDPSGGNPDTSKSAGADVDGVAPDELFQLTRSSNGTINYDIPVADIPSSSGYYKVNLYFVESGFNAAGKRVFDTAIEGVVPDSLDNLDPYAVFGNVEGGVISNIVQVDGDGFLNIDFLTGALSGAGGVQNPIISGIEIIEMVSNTGVISVTAPATTVESGDDATQTALTFALTGDAAVTGIVTVTYDVTINGVTTSGLTADVNFDAADPSLTVLVDNDAVNNGDDTVSLTLVSAGTFNVDSTPAVTSVTEDDPDTTAPVVDSIVLIEQPSVGSTDPVTVEVTISDEASAIDLASIADGDFTVTLDGSPVAATVASVTASTDGLSAVVALSVAAPTGGWADAPATLNVAVTGDVLDGASNAVDTAAASSSADLIVDGVPFAGGSATFTITPGTGLAASTFNGLAFNVVNNSQPGVTITNVKLDLGTGILPDMVFDPVGAGGDATAKVFTAGPSAGTVGLVAPADNVVAPFFDQNNGGWNGIDLDFTAFGSGESFAFGVDVDPNSIQGVAGAGAAGAVSGFELIGATVTVTFSDGSTSQVAMGSMFEDGSLGGSVATVATDTTSAAPTIAIAGTTDQVASLYGDQVNVANTTPTITVTGEAGASVTLLQMDARLFIQSGDPAFDVSAEELPFYANEAMEKVLYTGTIGAGGTLDIPVTLLETASASGNGGLNHFVAVVDNGSGQSMTSAPLVVKVAPNTAPVANDDLFVIDEDAVLLEDLFADNQKGADFDLDGDTLSVIEIDGATASVGAQVALASGALLTVNSDGTFGYDPNGAFALDAGQTFLEQFAYTLSDGNGGTDEGTVSIVVDGVDDANTAPDAAADFFIIAEDEVASGNVLVANGGFADSDPDGDTLTVSKVNGSTVDVGQQVLLSSGALLTLNANGTFTYDPNGAFDALAATEVGKDDFTYTVDDGNGGEDETTVFITINGKDDDPVNTAPVAQDDAFTLDEDATVNDNVLTDNGAGADADLDGDTLTVSAINGLPGAVGSQITLVSGALVTVNGDGTFTYDPNGAFDTLNAGQTAADSFTYTLSDGNGGTDEGTVSFTIDGVGSASPNEILGTPENDRLSGTANDDVIRGLGGNDRIFGNRGDDTVFGGGGDDSIFGRDGTDSLEGEDGADQIDGDAGDDIINGGAGTDRLFGGEGNDTLIAGLGNDKLFGEFAGNKTAGGLYSDTFVFDGLGGSNSVLDFVSGVDIVDVGAATDWRLEINAVKERSVLKLDKTRAIFNETLLTAEDVQAAGDGEIRYVGGDGDEVLLGLSNRDSLWGGNGNDTITGAAGNDILWGDEYNNTDGSVGADVFRIGKSDGSDKVFDFVSGVDSVELTEGVASNFRLVFNSGGNSVLQYGDTKITFFGSEVSIDDVVII